MLSYLLPLVVFITTATLGSPMSNDDMEVPDRSIPGLPDLGSIPQCLSTLSSLAASHSASGRSADRNTPIIPDLTTLTPCLSTLASLSLLAMGRSLPEEDRVDMCAKYGKSHTMCLTTRGPECDKTATTEIGLTKQEQLDIVAAHNTYRKLIANGGVSKMPKAANMRQMSWDADLALVAQRWADQCYFDHDGQNANLVPAFTSVGQNIFSANAKIDKPGCPTQQAVDAWYNEVGNYTMLGGTGEKFIFTDKTGHFTQVIWAETSKVGCGFAKYADPQWMHRFVVCNYGVGGNVVGNPMYKHGNPCSACPAGTVCKDSLCA